ncbi:alpha/beta fold hydrolase [Microlunatus soli]|uniref:Pimeloyl-ACP methyl ester carboxylesterase n=1 Tax=Microlunatus soli TaxID=630515 RepID=A0A1H1ZHV0_9ACTN|nr:alpha/beta fold hydrolase [Microlunatus soli]SDT33219.1 Pimeloyl-ACP methyl ester carboxylesterase [Microlunatus soli]
MSRDPLTEPDPTTSGHRREPGRHRRRLVIGALAVSLLANVVLIGTRDSGGIGSWRSQAGRLAYLSAYDEALAAMPSHRAYDVPTDFGTVRGYLFASPTVEDRRTNTDTTPIVLLPGWGSGTPMWQINLSGLVRHRPVYALDALGDAGRSIQSVPLDSAAAQAAWVEQALAGLKIKKAHIVGHSFGGWSATNFAIRYPGRVASLSLLDPVQTFGPIRASVVVRSLAFTLPLLPDSWRDAALADIGGTEQIDRNDPLTRMVALGNQHFVSHRSFPSRFSDPQLRSISFPVYAAMAADSAVNGDPDKAVARARRLVAGISIRSWPGASHSLPMERPAEINAELVAFMDRIG